MDGPADACDTGGGGESEGGGDGSVGGDNSTGGGDGTTLEAERKVSVSVKETTRKFDRMASECQLLSSSSRASSKSNRSSRSDKVRESYLSN